MTTPGPYSRVYWRFIEEYPDVYDDDRAFATWMRLLILAEGTHPQPAPLPHGIKNPVLSKLVDEGLVTLLPGNRYRVKGLAAERERRADKGRKGANARWSQSEGTADAMQTHSERNAKAMPAEQSRDEQSKDETRTNARTGGLEPVGSVMADIDVLHPDSIPLDVRRLQRLAEELTGQAYAMNNLHSGYGKKAVAEQLPHGFDRVERAWRKIANQAKGEGTSKPTLRQLVLGADDILNPVPQQDSSEQREQAARELFDRRVARTQAELEETKKLMGYDA